ncbi:hypothetical protein C7378_2638 [Acidipila rosea]|uniref:Transporter n=2 Tax=Acidipila rosea TaxID=768535 RepID=A0A4R1L4H0_9BACT|nr:hypothetical protein C7378_2638 [Acidipila rosea]
MAVTRRKSVPVVFMLAFVFICAMIQSSPLNAQGCIIAHSVGEVGGPESQGGYLQSGHFQLAFSYRHQYSFRHFVGSEEQVYRTQDGSNVRNRINLFDVTLTYQATPRFSVDANLPAEFASRRYIIPAHSIGNNPPVEITGDYGVSGAGDISFGVQGWLWNPLHQNSHNIQLGIGIQAPTGRDNLQNRLILTPGSAPIDSTADYSVQPGLGGWGIPITWTAFQSIGQRTQAYFNGSYLITPQETNGVANTPPPGFPPPAPQNAYISIADEYLAQLGFAYSMASVNGLTVSAGLREEGVPAHDLIGGNEGFRRPGYAVSFEPGVLYAFHKGNDLITANIDRAVYRNRVASVPDLQLGTHGDAAFADWLWLASFIHRF